MSGVMSTWRASLSALLRVYDTRRGRLASFIPRLFAFFVLVNIACYWLGLLVAYPEKLGEPERLHYFSLQFPVGLLGAVFDAASFFATLWLVRRALRSRSALEYVGHLSFDIVIAAAATLWVLLVFSVSGWILSVLEAQPEALSARNAEYEARLMDALRHPRANWRNLYFGIVMGLSAALPTAVHLSLFLRAVVVSRRETPGDHPRAA